MPTDDVPFLDAAPPPWAARALATILLAVSVTALAALIVIKVPETVAASFVLEPTRGADPVRTLHDGTIATVNVVDGQPVVKDAVMFVMRSELIGDRVAEQQTIDARIKGEAGRATNERLKYESRRRADEQEHRRLEERLANLRRQVTLKEQQLKLAREIADRMRAGADSGVSSWLDASRPQLDVDRLAAELEQVHSDIADASNALARLVHQMESDRAAFAEVRRALEEEATGWRARKRVLDRDTRPGDDGALVIRSSCAGTVVKLHVRNPDAVVHEGDLLAELACADETLQAELLLPERGLALVRTGQPVKLMYDAFPYQRYGVHFATLRWVSPASSVVDGRPVFRAFADLDAATIAVEGQGRPVLPGMSGRAAVIVGRRSLASYAIEPLRQMRESLAVGPPR